MEACRRHLPHCLRYHYSHDLRSDREWKVARYPLLPLRLSARSSNTASLIACFIHGAVFVNDTIYLPLYFQGVLDASALLSGVWLLPFVGAMALAVTFAGLFNSITGRFFGPIWFGFLSLTLTFGLMIDFDTTRNWPKIVIYQILAGVGPNFQALMLILQTGVSPQDIVMATAATGFDRNLASSVGIAASGVIFQNGVQKHSALMRDTLGPAAEIFLGGGAIKQIRATGKLYF